MKKDWSFVFVGGEIDGREVIETCAPLENVHFAGHIGYEKLPNRMACFDLLWIPYGMNDYTRRVFPIKFFEYLASGKPVVSTPIPALRKYAHLVEITDGAEEMLKALQTALATESPEKRSRRVAAARGNTWNHRIDRILEVLEGKVEQPPPGSAMQPVRPPPRGKSWGPWGFPFPPRRVQNRGELHLDPALEGSRERQRRGLR